MGNTTTWPTTTVNRSTLVVPTHGFGKGDVCPQASGYLFAVTPMSMRHTDAIQATPGSTPPWSPPVT